MSFKFTNMNKIWNRNILNLNISKKKTEKEVIIAAILADIKNQPGMPTHRFFTFR